MEAQGFDISFWEGEENWASILLDDKTVGYIWKKYPVIFIVSQYTDKMEIHLNELDHVSLISVQSLTSKELTIRYIEFEDESDLRMDNEVFSVEELWFHTNSV